MSNKATFNFRNFTNLGRFFPVFMVFIFSFHALGSEKKLPHPKVGKGVHVHGTHSECPLPKSTSDIVSCAQDNHPIVKRATYSINGLKDLPKVAAQRPNPTLNSRIIKGDSKGYDVYETEASLMFPVELGFKQDSRIQKARTKIMAVGSQKKEIQAKVRIETILKLHRLRQLLLEKKLTSQMISAFKKIVKRLSKIPKLSAAQEASLSIFQLAFSDAQVKQSEIFEEEREIEHYFHVSTGHSLSEIQNYLPKTPRPWPTVEVETEHSTPSPTIKKLMANRDHANSNLEFEKSNSWPTIKVGPAVSIEKDGNFENVLVGVNLSIPLPLFQTNGGGRSHARNQFTKTQKLISLTRAEERHERAEQLKIYFNAVKILSKTTSKSKLNQAHKKVEKLYSRGLISSSTLIESFRQRSELLKGRHNRELKALNALYLIHTLDGKIFEVKL